MLGWTHEKPIRLSRDCTKLTTSHQDGKQAQPTNIICLSRSDTHTHSFGILSSLDLDLRYTTSDPSLFTSPVWHNLILVDLAVSCLTREGAVRVILALFTFPSSLEAIASFV